MDRACKILIILTISVVIFYIISTLVDILVSLAVFRYAPVIFINNEANKQLISYIKGNYHGLIELLSINILFLAAPTLPLFGYIYFKDGRLRKLMLVLLGISLMITSSVSIGHITGAFSWLI